MHVTRISATPDEKTTVRQELQALFSHPPVLDPGADLAPALPRSGGIPGMWVTAPRGPSEPSATGAGVTIYVHGGGFAYTNPSNERIMAHRLSQATGRPAVAVDYRLAPAHPFPAAIEDVVTVYRSLVDQGVPHDRILLCGESAGGTLVLSTLLVLAEGGDALPAGAVAVSAVTDFAASGQSAEANRDRDIIDPDTMGTIDTQYLAGARPDQAPQSPIHGDLRGLPPLLIAVGGDEVLLDDSQRFAEAASAAGVPVDLDIHDGMPHVFHATVLLAESAHPPTATTFLHRLTSWTSRLPAAR